MIPYGVFYNRRLQNTFQTKEEARRYVREHLRDANADKNAFEVRLI